MNATLLTSILLLGIFGHTEAIKCFSNYGNSAMTNGSTVDCSTKTCYSYLSGSYFYSGCGSCHGSQTCVDCSTDFCNSRTPPTIDCFVTSGSLSNTNGSVMSCQTGLASCYSIMSGLHHSSGCGSCHPSSRFCADCNSSLCNARSPSSFSCYSRSAAPVPNNGTVATCPTAFKSCYSYMTHSISSVRYYGGCGDCSGTSDPTCVTCSSSNCNTVAPSTISCFTRRQTRDRKTSNGIEVTCHTGINTCYSAVSDFNSIAGCGSCNSSSDMSCTTCSTDHCNTATPSTISCYSRYRYSHYYGNGLRTSCPTGFTSCYSYVASDGFHYGDCGRCNGLHSNCTTCTGNYCNTIRPSAATTAATPAVVPTTSTGGTTSTMVHPSSIKCHQLSGNYISKRVSCSSTSCFEYQSTVGDVTSFHAGCGSCPARCSCSECRVCYSDFCNSGSVSKASVKLLQMLLRMAH